MPETNQKVERETLAIDKAEWWCAECSHYQDVIVDLSDIICGCCASVIATFRVTDPRQLVILLD